MITTNDRSWGWRLGIASWLAMGGALAIGGGLSPIAMSGDCTLAQIAPDTTLGAESPVVRPTNVNGITIDGGAVRGTNLFHSFEQFSVPTGGTAYFNNAADIQNIISRVTGTSISNIDGLIRANGTANLFLLNPNGIIFGPNASLDIGGSFVGSTASSLNFADGAQFSATASTTTLLTVSIPLGLQYGRTVKSIRNQSQAINSSGQVVGLQVQPGKTLALVGGNVELDGGNLQAPDGRVELGGLAEAGTLVLNVNGNNLSLSFPDRVARADVLLTNGSTVDVTAEGDGSIAINARNLGVLGGSSLSAGIQSGLGSVGRQAGNITLTATDAITIEQMSSIGNNVATDAIGQGGNLIIQTGQLLIRDGGTISTSTLGQGEGGDLNVIASDFVEVAGRLPNGRSPSNLVAETQGTGAAGNLRIQTRQLLVRDGALVSVSTDSIEENAGAGGDLTIETGQLVVRGGGQITAATTGVGAGGTLTVNASESVEVDGIFTDGRRRSSLETSSGYDAPNGIGKAGSLTIHTPRLRIKGGAVVSTSTLSQGEGGDLNVIASDFVEVAGRLPNGRSPSNLVAETQGTGAAGNLRIQTRQLLVRDGASVSVSTDSIEENAGAGGDLTIETGQLVVWGGGQITAATAGVGAGGTLTVNASESVEVDGIFTDGRRRSSLETSSGYDAPNGIGKAGSLTIHTPRLRIKGGAVVSTSTLSQGEGGDLDVIASDFVEVAGRSPRGRRSSLAADIQGTGAAGNLRIQTRHLLVRDGGNVSAETSGVAKGGDLNITTGLLDVQGSGTITVRSTSTDSAAKGAGRLEVTAQTIRLHNQAAITANTASGQGGDIILGTQNLLLLRDNSVISTTAGGSGNGGNIKIDTDILATLEDSDITANAFTGTGGNIQITTQGLFLSPDSQITASSERGINGVVEINAPDINPSQGLVALPAELVDASGLIAQTCPAGGGQGQSEFVVTGRGGLPPNSSEALSSEPVQVDWVTLNPRVENAKSPTVPTNLTALAPAPLVEAQGWVINALGKVVLTAHAPTVTPHISWQMPTSCRVPKSSR